MKRIPISFAVVAAILGAAALSPASQSHAAQADEPFTADVKLGAAYDDNLFRLVNETEAEALLGTDQMDDWYRWLEAGVDFNIIRASHRFDIDARIYRQTYDTFDDLDHTGGVFNARGQWSLAEGTRVDAGYRYQRKLQSFTNKLATAKDIIERNDFDAGLEQRLSDRWKLRLKGAFADLNFSTSGFLDKKQVDGEAEIMYAASQRSVFGLLATYTQSDYDLGDVRDFDGWSIGPSFEWALTSSSRIIANVGYTHRALDQSQPGVDDYDGVTGFVSGIWDPGNTLAGELRVYRDVSSLGGEISEYTQRTGISFEPTWAMTPKLTLRGALTYEERDFAAVDATLVDRKDDYMLADLWLDFAIARRFLISVGYAYEDRDSNVDIEDFDDQTVSAELQFTF